jgi:protein-S-isoprenylcysteine O-methyltransferase Ste14
MVQALLVALILFGPTSVPALPPWPPALSPVAGSVLLALGGALSLSAGLKLGTNLTPLPHPRDGATLVEGGLYRLVRHPIYLGVTLMAWGWTLWVQGWLPLAWTLALMVLFDLKARREEVWLVQHFPAYADYCKRVRRFIPFIY